MSPSDKSKGITVSGGRNYLLAMAHYGFRQSVPVNVIVPKDCPVSDKHQFKENFAIVKVHGSDFTVQGLTRDIYDQVRQIGAHSKTFTIRSDRLDLIAGYGTLGLDLLSQLDKMDAILCPVGSGNLVAGLIIAVKSLKPSCIIYVRV
ncbi:putative threonine dehydratase catabolic [Operophtera brumata]|uniref:Putative threonine dehydratase catabolic n=1 Tax=Operophtera brumata TaxID=104452 RepID=A0A0L7L5I2_OPEBR|nr:putative threonine dehydratase catabolic [Operophtera brumata]